MLTLMEIRAVLQRADYPATREDLIAQVRRMEGPEEIISRLRTLPEHRYGSTDTVLDALRDLP